MMQKNLFIIYGLGILLLFGCKSKKAIVSNGEIDANMTSKELVRNHIKSSADFKTIAARLKIEVVQGGKSQSYSVSLRMEKDKTIWMSKLGLVKALITPNRVAFYNKLDNTYFDGDFSYVSELLGTDLNFENLQNLLLGDALYSLDEKELNTTNNEKSYVLQPSSQDPFFEIFYLLNPTHYKMDSQQIAQSRENRFLQIDHKSYQEIEQQKLPEQTRIIAVEGSTETVIELGFKNIDLNKDLRFPFNIPSGYDEIELK